MKPVFLISPFRGDQKKNIEYAHRCIRDCLSRGEAPFGGHLLYPQVLDDANEADRKFGMEAGQAWLKLSGHGVVYIDHGISSGMWDDVRSLIGTMSPGEVVVAVDFRSLDKSAGGLCKNLNEIVGHFIVSKTHGHPTNDAVTALQHFIS